MAAASFLGRFCWNWEGINLKKLLLLIILLISIAGVVASIGGKKKASALMREQRLAAADVRYVQPVFYTRKILHAATDLDPNHKELLEFLFRKFPAEKMGINPFENARTCAIVGNSGNLRGSNYGPIIDSHDVVLRMNDVVIEGYETDVGRKTTIILTCASKMPAIYSNDIHFITYCDHIPETLMTIHKFLSGKKLFVFKSINVLNNTFFFSLIPYTKSKPSTGMAAVFLGLHHCDKVDLFGFGKDAMGEWDHYYTTDKWNPNNTFHSVTQEEESLNEFERKKLIRIYRGKR